MQEIKHYQITPEKFLSAEDVLLELQNIKRIKRKKVFFGRWDYTNYKRIYVDISEPMNELGYIDLVRIRFIITARPDLKFFTPELIDEGSYKINKILDKFREKNMFDL